MNPPSAGGGFHALVKRVLRVPPVGEVVRRIGALRGRSLVLVYHRIDEDGRPAGQIVPSVPANVFGRQLDALGEVGEIVPLRALLQEARRSSRPRFAVTFDDDFVTHVDHALPILRDRGVPATFFLSGRSLVGLGSYWFEILEQLIDTRGMDEVTRLIGTRGEGAQALVTACESDPALQRSIEEESHDPSHNLDRSGIESLAAADMAIGFHTLRHEILTRLDDGPLEAALAQGRKEMESVVGHPLLHFAYPHGKADRRTANRIRDAGYEAAWTGSPRPMHPRDDPYLLGRWEPGRLAVDDLLVGVAIRLNRGPQG
jgi:peptidoglycan/xylan/chitin deacetylase (PgdA/CDA1 family)